MSYIQLESSTAFKKKQYKKKQRKPYRLRKRKIPAVLLAALLPGLGHIYLGLFKKGVLFILALLLDASALLYFSSTGMNINVPLLILLALMIPVIYFYNVFDVLQAADYIISRRRTEQDDAGETVRQRPNPFLAEKGISFGVLLVCGGLLLFFFYQKPAWLAIYMNIYGEIIVAAALISLGIGFLIREMVRSAGR
ncbi:hypothetical protein J2T13_002867 [Paenibacillus sp. DS2015]|uniref:hypothetical protein n=1 Tax=Paenibacillus sp. DS2015 TaxID=3373917 RepID=UPI003D2357F7